MPPLAPRLAASPPAATVAMTERARALRAAGVAVITLSIGEPDFPTPEHAIEAACEAARRGETKYPPQAGTPALREAVRRKYRRDFGLEYGPDEVMIGNGGKQVIFNAVMATVAPGDEVIIPTPYWASYSLMVELAGGRAVFLPCPEARGFRLDAEALARTITPKSRLLLLNFPNNPSGAVMTAEDAEAIAAVLRRHPDLWVLCDDIYGELTYDGARHLPLAARAPDLRERLLIVSGVSKTYAMTGWRIGFGLGPAPLIRAMVTMQGHATAGVSAPGQAAAAAALEGPQELVAERVAVFRRRRDLLLERLAAAPGLTCHRPEGAFYLYPNVGGLIGRTTPQGRRLATDTDVALALLEEAHVAVVAGAAFGMSPYVRLSYATSEALLEEAARRIVAFCAALG